jgi:hypothetical protein
MTVLRLIEITPPHLKRHRPRKVKFLYMDSWEWMHRAYEATGSKAEFAYALLLYRYYRVRRRGDSSPVIAGTAAAVGFSISKKARLQAVRKLQRAGLIKINNSPGQAYRVSIIPC